MEGVHALTTAIPCDSRPPPEAALRRHRGLGRVGRAAAPSPSPPKCAEARVGHPEAPPHAGSYPTAGTGAQRQPQRRANTWSAHACRPKLGLRGRGAPRRAQWHAAEGNHGGSALAGRANSGGTRSGRWGQHVGQEQVHGARHCKAESCRGCRGSKSARNPPTLLRALKARWCRSGSWAGGHGVTLHSPAPATRRFWAGHQPYPTCTLVIHPHKLPPHPARRPLCCGRPRSLLPGG